LVVSEKEERFVKEEVEDFHSTMFNDRRHVVAKIGCTNNVSPTDRCNQEEKPTKNVEEKN